MGSEKPQANSEAYAATVEAVGEIVAESWLLPEILIGRFIGEAFGA